MSCTPQRYLLKLDNIRGPEARRRYYTYQAFEGQGDHVPGPGIAMTGMSRMAEGRTRSKEPNSEKFC